MNSDAERARNSWSCSQILEQRSAGPLHRRKGSFSAAWVHPGPGSPFPAFLLLQVGEVYRQLHTAMSQAPVKENIPYSWASLACVKAHHYGALAHYFAATLLIDHQCKAWGLGRSGALVRVVLPEHSAVGEPCLPALQMLTAWGPAWDLGVLRSCCGGRGGV